MNLRFLRTFVATAELGGLGHASQRLNLSQPAASRQIRALEGELGVPLFQQIGRRLQLTSEGENLLQYGRRLLTDADLLAERARALKGGHEGTLRVGATAQLITALLASFLPGHRRRHPGIAVQLIEGSAARQRIQLERGDTDLAIMPASDTRFPGRLLFPVHALAVVQHTHRLARRATIDVAEIAHEPLLLLQPGFGSRATFDAACEIAQINPRVLLECTAAHTLISLVAVRYGVAVVPSTTIIQARKLCALPLLLRGASIGYWEAVCWDRRRVLPTFLQPFVNELVAHANTTSPGRKSMRRAPTLLKPGKPFI